MSSTLPSREKDGAAVTVETQRYRGPDRRSRPTPMFSRYSFRGRRHQLRRDDEMKGGYYVDRHSRFEMVAVLSLLVLTITDALATLHILGKGGVELNPLMRHALDVSHSYFLFAKLGISLIGGSLILVHSRFPGVKKALYGLLVLYGSVVVYHAMLLSRVPS